MEKQLDPVIEIQHLNKSFGSVHAVNDLSFQVRKGELFAFLGVNGAGQEHHDLDYLRAAEKGQWRGKDRRQRSRSEAGRH